MKLRSADLDDVWNELQFVLDDDDRRFARLTRKLFTWAYRAFRAFMLLALGLPWRSSLQFPELGLELEREWGQH